MNDSQLSEGEEDQIRQAIALSLQDQSSPPAESETCSSSNTAKEIIDLCSDDDLVPSAGSRANGIGGGLLGLDRKVMEEERLARKRKAPISPPAPREVMKVTDSASMPRSSHEEGKMVSISSQSRQTDREWFEGSDTTFETTKVVATSLKFPNGAVKKTWAFGYARNEDIKIEEVFERQDLTLAMLSSFQWDVEWLLGKIDASRTKMIFVMQAKEESTRQNYQRETARMENLRLCFPPMEGQVNCMHSKLMLLAHPTYLRIVVPTANLVPYDWGEYGTMENMLFLIDLPRLPDGQSTSMGDLTFFGRELTYFLEAMGLPKDVIESTRNFDFSSTQDFAFVHTIGGMHVGENEPWRRTGYCGLGRAIDELGLSIGHDHQLEVDFVTSSIGALSLDFLTMLYLASKGDDGLKEYNWRTNTSKKETGTNNIGSGSLLQMDTLQEIQGNFRIYFPTQSTVATSRGGADSGGTICFQPKWYNAPTFPRRLLRDCKSQRDGMLMHNKVSAELMDIMATADNIGSPVAPRSSEMHIRKASCYFMGICRVSKLFGECLGQTLQRQDQATQAQLPKLGVRCCHTNEGYECPCQNFRSTLVALT
ncbi:hypothetical protein MMC06_004600 [Schaereria dolodes]|nr:hypothetical protein [Schaereria dolodes]